MKNGLSLVIAWSVTALLAGCGSDRRALVTRWTQEVATEASPAGTGPEGRVLIGTKTGAAQLRTLDEVDGRMLEGPFSSTNTEHAPVAIGSLLYVVSSAGRVFAYDLAGMERHSSPRAYLKTSPIGIAPDGTLRLASTNGDLIRLGADLAELETTSVGTPNGLAIAADGTTYVATSEGRLRGFRADGSASGFDVMVHAPASGPSVSGSLIIVGELDGVSAFQPSGAVAWRKERGARVTGTAGYSDGTIGVWGEDGVFERFTAEGTSVGRYVGTPPIYAHVAEIGTDGEVVVIDDAGTALLLAKDGTESARLELGARPATEVARSTRSALAFVAVGSKVIAIEAATLSE